MLSQQIERKNLQIFKRRIIVLPQFSTLVWALASP